MNKKHYRYGMKKRRGFEVNFMYFSTSKALRAIMLYRLYENITLIMNVDVHLFLKK